MEVAEVTRDIPDLLGVHVPQQEFLNQERSIPHAEYPSDPEEGQEDTALARNHANGLLRSLSPPQRF